MVTDRDFLMWLHQRLERVHNASPTSDFMHRLRAIIRATPEDKSTPSCGTCNSLEELIRDMQT